LEFKEVLTNLNPFIGAAFSMELHLSAAYCPAVEITYPVGVERFAEKEAFARSTCAMRQGVAPEELMIQLDPQLPEIAVPLLRIHWDTLRTWLQDNKLNLRSAKPLWTLAAGLSCVRGHAAIALTERDGVTLLGTADSGAPLRGLSLPLVQPEFADAQLNRMHQSLSLGRAETKHVKFADAASPGDVNVCSTWSSYWSIS